VKISKRQIRNIVLDEVSKSSKRNSNMPLEIDVKDILREQKKAIDEGMFSSAMKALATKAGGKTGRFASDYFQARGFDDLEDATAAMEQRLEDLESRIAALESGGSVSPMLTP
jgi:hypothetical protein|tara:strand:+ start:4611 stop:4949 length:339 start_codon:yes stop_codon:yes gene_type:complete